MRLPLHIHPDDRSVAANRARYEHHLNMASLNPSGFRKQPKVRESRKLKREVTKRGTTKPPCQTRTEWLADAWRSE